jgi:hypothetical protein
VLNCDVGVFYEKLIIINSGPARCPTNSTILEKIKSQKNKKKNKKT